MAKSFRFSGDELDLIERWYYSAAGESASGSGANKAENDKLRALLKKLGIEPHLMDQHEFSHEN